MEGLADIKSPRRSWIGKGKVSFLAALESCADAPDIAVIENAMERKQLINNQKYFGPKILLNDIREIN